MMSSPAFYHTFDDIKKLLLSRPVVHSTGGEFLGVLKMLMAQIQASDWRSIENSLGSQRAKLLLNHLPNALKYGRTDCRAEDSQFWILTNYLPALLLRVSTSHQ
jgi:hypothetical protein